MSSHYNFIPAPHLNHWLMYLEGFIPRQSTTYSARTCAANLFIFGLASRDTSLTAS